MLYIICLPEHCCVSQGILEWYKSLKAMRKACEALTLVQALIIAS